MKKLMLIANPFSGQGKAKTSLFPVLDEFCKNDYSPTVYISGGEKTCRSLAAQYASQYDLLVCMGGDGTLSDVASGLMEIPEPDRPAVGYIPMGTANDIASTLSLSVEPVTAVANIIKKTPSPYDMGKWDGGYFAYIAAFGAFTEVSYSTPQSLKRAFGHAAYVFSGLSALPAIKPKHTVVDYEGGTITGDFIFGAVCNSTSVAGLIKLKPDAVDLSDGMFEVILVRNPMTAADFLNIISNVSTQHFDSQDVMMLHTPWVKFSFDEPVAWTRDGEDGGKHENVVIENCCKALNIVF